MNMTIKTINTINKSNLTKLSKLLAPIFCLALGLCTALSGHAAEVISAQARLIPFEVETSQIAQIEIKIELPKGFKAYEDKFKLEIVDYPDFKLAAIKVSPTHEIFDKFSKKNKMVVTDNAIITSVFEVPVLQTNGEQTYKIKLSYQMCNENYCLFPANVITDMHFKAINKSTDNNDDQNISFFDLSFKQVFSKGLGWAFFFVFIFGFLTSFTPCIYPMIPITLAILGREAHARSKWQNFLVSFTYVTGIGVTFSGLGVLAASSGLLFGSFMSSPWILGLVSLVFLAMSLSMFGLYEIEAPQFLRDGTLSKLKLHGYAGALASGMLAGFVASPCVGPVLVGILTFVAQSKNIWLGFWLLFTYSFGMGLIFLILGLSSGLTKKLPKSGPWMSRVKLTFAMIMLLASVYYMKMIYDIIGKSNSTEGSTVNTNTETNTTSNAINAEAKSQWKKYSAQELADAAKNHKPVLIDVRADWCAACLELEEKTFATEGFAKLGEQFVLLRVDATQSTPEVDAIRDQYQLVGLPTLIFISPNGKWLQEMSVSEFIPFEKLEPIMQKVLSTQ